MKIKEREREKRREKYLFLSFSAKIEQTCQERAKRYDDDDASKQKREKKALKK